MNKRGWVKIVEAFIVVLLIIAVLLVIINQANKGENISSRVYKSEVAILREIQINDSLRDDILNSGELPVIWDSESFPSDVKALIEKRNPGYLNCTAKICTPEDSCHLDSYPDKDTYANSITITSTLSSYSPRQLKIFCWMK